MDLCSLQRTGTLADTHCSKVVVGVVVAGTDKLKIAG